MKTLVLLAHGKKFGPWGNATRHLTAIARDSHERDRDTLSTAGQQGRERAGGQLPLGAAPHSMPDRRAPKAGRSSLATGLTEPRAGAYNPSFAPAKPSRSHPCSSLPASSAP